MMTTNPDTILENACRYGTMDYSKWPGVLEFVLTSLDNTVYNEFPPVKIPIIPAAAASPASARNGAEVPPGTITPTRSPKVIPATPQNPNATGASLDATPDNQSTSPSVVPSSQPPAPADSASSSSNPPTTKQPAESTAVEPPAGTLPPPILALYNGILGMLNGPFSQVPPYTIQRLSELVLYPRAHYQTLPAYLRALDKTLSVASTADVYPLPVPPDTRAAEGKSYLSQANGINAGPSLRGRDDAFNGAELTRIPWVVDSAEGDGEADAPGEREDGMIGGLAGTNQPERMLLSDAEDELRGRRTSPGSGAIDDKAKDATSSVTVNGLGAGSLAAGSTGAGVSSDTVAMQTDAAETEATVTERSGRGDNEEMATARGPEEIGNEDIGPQRGEGRGMPGIVDLEAAVGRPGEGEIVEGSNVQVPEERRATSEEPKESQSEEGTEMAIDEKEKKEGD